MGNEAKNWVAVRVEFEADAPEAAAELIASVFYDLGVSGVVVETPGRDPEPDWDPAALPPESACAVTGYVPSDDRAAGFRRRLEAALSAMASRSRIRWRIALSKVDEEDWAESWKAHFHPQRVGSRTVIRPSWEPYRPAAGDVVIELDPGMAFGTGTHPTTRLCIQLLERWIFPGARFLDIGTGSGVLMCVAAAFGAGQMLGIDNDPLAVAVAEENLRRNGVAKNRCQVRIGDLLEGIDQSFEVVAANILTPVILKLLDGIDRVLAPAGIVIVSGVLEENAETAAARMRERSLEVFETRAWEDWAALAGRKSKAP